MRRINVQQTAVRQWTQPDTQTVVIPAPTGGWNAIDPLAKMDPKYAPIMDNWIPRPGWVETRSGYSAWNQSLVANTPVESLLTYRSGTAEKLFAACGSQIFDVSLQGISSSVQSGLSNARWQQINFTPALGTPILYIVNGADNPRYWNGTTWTIPTITGTTQPQTTFINIGVWKRRIWFVESNSTIAAYLATDAITGAVAGELDIGALLNKGGHLVAIGSLTVDGGNGPDDLLVLISSRGEVICYKGTDPTNASAFSIVGVFDISPPLGNRPFMRYGADLAIITLQGVLPLSQALPLDAAAVRGIALTNKIQNAMLQSAQMFQSNFGWEMTHFPAQSLFVMNVPTNTNVQAYQYVMNTLTGAWCRFTGWNANCFGLYNDNLYFGDNKGNVNIIFEGGADLVTPIVSDLQCAFNYFGEPSRLKQMLLLQPQMVTSGLLTPTLSVDVDFGSTSPASNVQFLTTTGAQFGTAIFGTSTFAPGTSTQNQWQAVTAQGHALAIRMKVNLLPPGAGSQSVFDTGVFNTLIFDDFGTATNILQLNSFNAVIRYGGTI